MSQLQSLEASVSPSYIKVYQGGQSVVTCTHQCCCNILLLQLDPSYCTRNAMLKPDVG